MNTTEVWAKWKVRAKNIQDCHYDTAAALKCLHYITGVPLVALSAISASTIFADAAGIFPPFGQYSKFSLSVIALLVTILAAIQAFLGFEKRADLHYKAGVKYGALKRSLEVTVPTPTTLTELGKTWDTLTEESPGIPQRIWRRNEQRKQHKTETGDRHDIRPRSAETPQSGSRATPTHGGGVVFRRDGNTIQYLVVQAKRAPHEWVLPKGHVKHSESVEDTARREVLEETGLAAAVWHALETVEFSTSGERVTAQFFLMVEVPGGGGEPREGRERKWLTFEQALETLRFNEARQLVESAHTFLQKTIGSGVGVAQSTSVGT